MRYYKLVWDIDKLEITYEPCSQKPNYWFTIIEGEKYWYSFNMVYTELDILERVKDSNLALKGLLYGSEWCDNV